MGNHLLAEYANGTTYFIHADHLGSARLRTTVSGAVYDSFDYLPYGEVLSGINDYVPKFTGDALDNETAWTRLLRPDAFDRDHTLFRQYAGSLGRWMSPDPLAGDISDPQSLNRYAYVRNTPLNAIDPLGADTFYSENCTYYDQDYYVNGEKGGTDHFVPGPFCGGGAAAAAGGGGNGGGGGGGTNSGKGVQSFASCVSDAGKIFSIQGTLQFISGGKLGNGWFSNAFLGNTASDVIDAVQAAGARNYQSAGKIVVGVAGEKAAVPTAKAAANFVPNVAFVDQAASSVISRSATEISVTTTSDTLIHVFGLRSMAKGATEILGEVVEGPKDVVDAVGAGFGAALCAIARPQG